jgi:hypothetical protein
MYKIHINTHTHTPTTAEMHEYGMRGDGGLAWNERENIFSNRK